MNVDDRDTRKLPMNFNPLPKVGQEFGHFIIERELPRGGQARVFRAWQTDLNRPVALKLLPATFIIDAEAQARFRREVENVAKLTHPNVVKVYQAGEIEGQPFFTMEYLDGEDAETRLKRGRFEPDEAASIIEVVARAVAEAHAKGIVHRDIKPGNVFIKRDGTPVLADFGLAQDLSKTGQLTQTGVSMGTPAYMSPEQARGERHRVGKRSDIYALGATLYSMLTGKRPAEGESAYEIMMKVAESPGPRWSRGNADDIPPDLRAVVEMAMQNDPAKRYESATAFGDDLERFLAGEWVSARSRSWVQKAFMRVRRYAPVSAVMLVAAGLGAALVWTSLDPPSRGSNTGELLPERPIWKTDNAGDPEAFIKQFADKWITSGATMSGGAERELVLTRKGEETIRLEHQDEFLWGDFELEARLAARDARGEVTIEIGLPPPPPPDKPGTPDPDPGAAVAAYSIVLGAHAPQRFEIRRLGKTVTSGQSFAAPQLLVPGAWYRAKVVRSAENIRFELLAEPVDIPVAVAVFDDDFPALIEGRRRFALTADAAALSVRDVSIRHRETPRASEALLFSVGAFAEAELRLQARLSTPPRPDDNPDDRAGWEFMLARCLHAQGKVDEALLHYAKANAAAIDSRVRARALIESARIQAGRGEDIAARTQLFVARRVSDNNPELASRVYCAALEVADKLEVDAKPERALTFYDFVVDNNMSGDASLSYFTCTALRQGAELRMKLAAKPGPDPAALRRQALVSLQRVRDNFKLFGREYYGSLLSLYDLRLPEILAKQPSPEGARPVRPELIDAGALLAAAPQGLVADRKRHLDAIVRTAWLASLDANFRDDQRALQARIEGFARAADGLADAQGKLWLRALRLLHAEGHRWGNPLDRLADWQRLADDLAALNRSKPDPRLDALVFLADFFVSAAPVEDRERSFRRSMARALPEHATLWLADASADAFSEFVIAIGHRDDSVYDLLDAVAARPDAGLLTTLSGRTRLWLPPEG